MKEPIRFNGVMDTFGWGNPEKNVFATYFPEYIDPLQVVGFLADRPDLVTNPEQTDYRTLLPNREPTREHGQAVTASLQPGLRNETVIHHLETQFNLLARPWQANFAGTSSVDNSSPVYTIVEGLSDELQEFLDIEETNERVALLSLTGVMEPAVVILGEDPKKFGMSHTITDRYFDFAKVKRDFSRVH